MVLKSIAFAAVAVAALFGQSAFAFPPEYAGDNGYHLHHAAHHEEHHEEHHHAPSPYHFEYGVKDPYTHDIKSQHEVSDGHGNVKGTYSLVEPDGSTRVVEYTADDHNGFNAKVKRIEAAHHHEPAAAYPKPSLLHHHY